MPDPGEELLHRGSKLTLHALSMVDIVLNEGVIGADFIKNADGLEGGVEIKAWNIEGVDRLNE